MLVYCPRRQVSVRLANMGMCRIELDRVMPSLGPRLLRRFESKEGYRAFDDVEPCCEWLTCT